MILYAKGLDIACVPPPGGARSVAFRRLSPLGLVPALELDDGTVLPESETIAEYLEDRFPEPPLRPADSFARARARLLARLADLYLAEALKQLFEETKTAEADPAALARHLPPVREALAEIDRWLAGGGYAAGGRLSLADAALVPLVYFVHRSAALFEGGAPFAGLAKLEAYWRGMAADPHAARVLAELDAAQARRAAQRARGEKVD
jgi:glutathione S-transferase